MLHNQIFIVSPPFFVLFLRSLLPSLAWQIWGQKSNGLGPFCRPAAILREVFDFGVPKAVV